MSVWLMWEEEPDRELTAVSRFAYETMMGQCVVSTYTPIRVADNANNGETPFNKIQKT